MINLIYYHDMIQHSKLSMLRAILRKLTVFMMIENTRQHLNKFLEGNSKLKAQVDI